MKTLVVHVAAVLLWCCLPITAGTNAPVPTRGKAVREAPGRAKARAAMVSSQIAARGIADTRVLEAMRRVPRHLFIPRGRRWQAYGDHPVPIGCGQTISQPFIVAYMTEILELGPESRVLEIGTGSGYQAAVLAEITPHVHSIEIIPELAVSAGKALAEAGYGDVHLKEGDGYFGWESEGPWDAVIVTAAAEHVPPSLVRQLKTGGKICIPVGSPFGVQFLLLIEKDEQGKVTSRNLMPVRFVPLTRKRR